MKKKEKMWFSGVWAIPLGIVLAVMYGIFVSHIRTHRLMGNNLIIEDSIIIAILDLLINYNLYFRLYHQN